MVTLAVAEVLDIGCWIGKPELGNELIVVSFSQNLLDVFGSLGLLQEPAERFVVKLLGNVLKCLEVFTLLIRR